VDAVTMLPIPYLFYSSIYVDASLPWLLGLGVLHDP
jgi:hypothetical protein